MQQHEGPCADEDGDERHPDDGHVRADDVGHRLAKLVEDAASLADTAALEAKSSSVMTSVADSRINMTGAGVRTAARLLTEVAAKHFETSGRLAAYVSLASMTRRSGSSMRGEHPSRRRNKILNRALFLSEFAALRDPLSRRRGRVDHTRECTCISAETYSTAQTEVLANGPSRGSRRPETMLFSCRIPAPIPTRPSAQRSGCHRAPRPLGRAAGAFPEMPDAGW